MIKRILNRINNKISMFLYESILTYPLYKYMRSQRYKDTPTNRKNKGECSKTGWK